jgi:putative transposase
MGRKREKEVNRSVTLDELNSLIKSGEKSVRILERLYFIRFLYKGDTIKEACERIGITEPTGYSWLKAWNDSGYKGLEPHFSGGPKPKLGSAERTELFHLLHERETWTLREIRILIKEKFEIEFSEMHVWRILKSMKMHHGKPYVLDKRRPDDAEDILKKISY